MMRIVGYEVDSDDLPCHELEPAYEAGDDHDGLTSDKLSVQGRLKKHTEFWREELELPSFVKEVFMEGYRYSLAWAYLLQQS